MYLFSYTCYIIVAVTYLSKVRYFSGMLRLSWSTPSTQLLNRSLSVPLQLHMLFNSCSYLSTVRYFSGMLRLSWSTLSSQLLKRSLSLLMKLKNIRMIWKVEVMATKLYQTGNSTVPSLTLICKYFFYKT